MTVTTFNRTSSQTVIRVIYKNNLRKNKTYESKLIYVIYNWLCIRRTVKRESENQL